MPKDEFGAPEVVEVDGLEIKVTNPEKVFFPQRKQTKMDLVRYFVEVGQAAVNGARDRPTTLHRFPNGVEDAESSFYQKRVPSGRPEWVETVRITFPSRRTADEVVVANVPTVVWMATLGCLEINPWPVRKTDVDHPDELRIDLDPTPGIPFDHVRQVARVAREVLHDHGLEGFPKTSGKRGIHVNVRIEPEQGFTEVRRAALALAREVERRSDLATTAWWKEQRTGVFVDYNQNARDRTVASAYSVRPVPGAWVSCPITWDEVPDVEPDDLRMDTVPARLRERGDAGAGIDERAGSLDALLDLAARDEREGLGEAPWPPHFPKAPGEPTRVSPSRAKKPSGARKRSRKRSP